MLLNKTAFFSIVFSIATLVTLNVFAEASEFTAYHNKESCYRVNIPKGWAIETFDDDLAATSPAESKEDKHFENLEIWTETLDEPMTLDTYNQKSIANLKKRMAQFTLKEEGVGQVSAIPARWFRATVKSGGVNGEVLQYQALAGNRIYILNFTAEPSTYDKYAPLFKEIVSSFTLLEDCQ
jgi:hypothetical protein